jgi:hypothetical protein
VTPAPVLPALWRFTSERFPLAVHLPMVAVFALGNVALWLSPQVPLAAPRLLAAGALALLYFYRLRCFDELKDHEHDRRHHPDRPLARGLVTRRHLGVVIALGLLAELGLAAGLFGLTGLFIHALAQGYSLLMYREFFLATWLRPRLTTYAVSHTFSAALLAAALGLLYARVDPRFVGPSTWLMLLFNWALFNLFEFARKTWAPEEDARQDLDSYSRRFGVAGAVLLSWSQVAGALLLLALHPLALEVGAGRGWGVALQLALALLPLGGGVLLMVRRTTSAAHLYRGLVSAYLVLFYLAVALAPVAGAVASAEGR